VRANHDRRRFWLTPLNRIDQSPPRRELKNSDPEVRDLSLAQLQLAPSSILLLNFLEPRFNGMLVVLAPTRNARANMMTRLASTFPAPLRPDMLALAQNLPAPPVFDPTRAPAKETGKKIGSGSGLTGDKKIPKWLKLPGASMSHCIVPCDSDQY